MYEVLWFLAVFAGWAALAYKLWDLRRAPGSESLRLICATFACMAGATLASPSTYVAFDRLVGIPNLAELIMNAGGMGFVLAVQRLLLLWAYPPERARRRFRWWQVLYLLALVAQVVLFVLAPVREEAPWFTVRYADTPFARESIVMVDVCLLLTLTDIARLCWRYASVAGRRYLRLGLHLTGIGAISGTVFFFLEALYVVARSAAHVSVFSDDLLGQLFTFFALGGALFITGGLTIPAWGPRLAGATAWIGKYRAYRRLHPLWLAVYQANPDIALDPPTTLKDPLWINDLDYRLVRRVVEIRDGRLALRPYFSNVAAQHAHQTAEHAGLHGVRLRALIEAAIIADAARAKREHTEPGDPCSLDVQGGADLAGEAAWLGHVARALTRLRPTRWPTHGTTNSEQALSAP